LPSFEPVLSIHCLAALDLGADVEQPFNQLSHYPEMSGCTFHGEVDGLDIQGQHGQQFVLLHHTHRSQRGYTPFVHARVKKMSVIGVEVVKLNPRCSRKGNSRRMGASVSDESTESHNVVQPLCIPSVIHPKRHISDALIR